VVAEEVRRLAERSANSTREIAVLVKSIQDDTAEAVVAMEESTREVVDGSKVADDAGKALAAIENVVNQLANLITNISRVSQQQAQNSSSIAQTMVEIEALTQEATALRQKSTETVAMVSKTADELRESVKTFRVEREESGNHVLPYGYDDENARWQPPVQPSLLQYTEMPTRPPVPPMGIDLDSLAAAVDDYEQGRANESRPPVTNGDAVPGFLNRQTHSAANGGTYQKPDEDVDIQKLLSEDADLFDSMIDEVGTGRGHPKDKTGGLRPPAPPALG
jgi:Methyl-accepting chemotaxis protein (MCP) signalling domain